VWFADLVLEGVPEVSGRVRIAIGDLELVGTVDDRRAGTFGAAARLRVVGGAGRWGALLAPKHYHNDAGVRARTLAEDAAREAGEELAQFEPESERIGVSYVRPAGLASRALEDAAGAASWWVAYDGRTHVGRRATSEARAGSYQLLSFAPDSRIAELALDDLREVGIGSTLTDGLDRPETVRELELEVSADAVRVRAWCGGEDGARGRLISALRSIARRSSDDRLVGLYRYRAVRMASERVELQAVRRRAGLPDVLPISMCPGVPGVHADLTPGAEVLVAFEEGLRAYPVIVSFVGKGGPGFVPSRLTLGASGSAPDAARKGDRVRVVIPASSFIVEVSGGSGAPAVGVLNPAEVEVEGEIVEGSSVVGIG